MNNYNDVDSLELLITEIDKAIVSKMYLAALHMALSIPDMLGKIAYKNEEPKKYIKWFDENVRDGVFNQFYSKNPLFDGEDNIKMNGEVCYALRCKLFHEGIDDLEKKTIGRINEFVLCFTDEDFVRGEYAGIDYDFKGWDPSTGKCPQTNYLYISCKGLCKEIVKAAADFRRNNPQLDYPKIRINHGGGRFNNDWF